MIVFKEFTPLAIEEFSEEVTELLPGTQVQDVPEPFLGPPYLILHIPDTFGTFPLCIHAGQGLQGVDKDALRVVDL